MLMYTIHIAINPHAATSVHAHLYILDDIGIKLSIVHVCDALSWRYMTEQILAPASPLRESSPNWICGYFSFNQFLP